jgi:hypothetical protein
MVHIHTDYFHEKLIWCIYSLMTYNENLMWCIFTQMTYNEKLIWCKNTLMTYNEKLIGAKTHWWLLMRNLYGAKTHWWHNEKLIWCIYTHLLLQWLRPRLPTSLNSNVHVSKLAAEVTGKMVNVCLVTEQWILVKETKYFQGCTRGRPMSKKKYAE